MSEQKLSMNYVLEQMEKIMAETEYLHKTIEAIRNIAPASGPGDLTGQGKADALATVVKCRETTNQKMLAMYEKMYDDLKPEKPVNIDSDRKLLALKAVEEIFTNTDVNEDIAEQLNAMLTTITRL